MRKSAQIARTIIIQALSDGQFHSGESLGALAGVSRSAIANHIKFLATLGLDIFSVKGRGYKLATVLDMLNKDTLVEKVSCLPPEHIELHSIISSTNEYIKSRLIELPKGYTCLAEAQTQGKGRRGRQWVSPFGASIYMSMAWQFSGGYQSMAGLSLLVGIAIKNALTSLGVPACKLKWPNDVYADGKKLAGILVEVEGQVGSDACAVIGIGINVNLPASVEGIDQPFTDVSALLGRPINRNVLAATVITTLHAMLLDFETRGLQPYVDEWQHADLFYGQTVRLISGKNEVRGINRGINESGALLLEVNGNTKAYHGGEISVRAS